VQQHIDVGFLSGFNYIFKTAAPDDTALLRFPAFYRQLITSYFHIIEMCWCLFFSI